MNEMPDSVVIPVKGMPQGEHSFSFAIGAEFFQSFGNDRIKDADCSVRVNVVRHQTLLEVECLVGGYVVTECDRCLDDLTLKVDVEQPLTVGFGNLDVAPDAESDEDVIVIDRNEAELNLDQFVYDYVCLSLPLVKVHPEGKCNPRMLKYLTDKAEAGVEETSTPFEGLKDMLNNND